MKRILVFSICAGLMLAGLASAGEMTNGLTITGGENAFAQLKVERANLSRTDDGVLKLHVSLAQAKNLKGYGFVLNFDPAKYEFVEAKEITGNLLNAGSDQQTLFISSSRTPGQISLGAMKVDGQGASGEGKLVELTFKALGTPISSDFQIAEGVLVGVDGNIDVMSHIEIGDLKPRPDHYGLGQNMPNPFNPSTTIGYQLPESGQVRLSIYNLLGQEIRTLVNEPMEAGYYTAVWDGKDDGGRQVASGIYIYRMQSGKFVDARRMMLLK